MFKKLDTKIRDWNHKRIDVMRAFKLSLAQAIFPLFAKKSRKENANADILVFRLDDKLGDSITSTGFLKELKHNFSSNRLVVLSGKNAAFIYKKLKFIDEVIVVKKGILQTLRAYLILRGKEYRFIFNTSHILTPQVIFLSSFLKAWKKITFLNSTVKAFTHHIRYDENKDHVTVRYQKSLEAVGIEQANLDYQLVVDQNEHIRQLEKAIFELRQKGTAIIVLNSFAGARLRNLSQKTTTEIVKGILEQHHNAVVVSIGNEDDLQKIQYWVTAFNDPRWVCYPRQGSLGFNLALAQHAALIITPDTSWVHVASALKKSVVAIYREDESRERNSLIWAPYKTKNVVVFAPFDQARPHDINTVDVAQVVAGVEQLLSDV
jgi:ADP-heptose:LPS heptosyltransferase